MTIDRARAVRIFPVGPVAAGAIAWRTQGELTLTLIVKATFNLVPRGDMTLAEPEEIVVAEVHHRDNPMRSIRLSSDLAPRLARADVMLTGHACTPAGRRAPVQPVRLAVYRGQALVDKTLHVHGDRKDGVPQPFDRIPLVYERAFGGIGWQGNPLGVGL